MNGTNNGGRAALRRHAAAWILMAVGILAPSALPMAAHAQTVAAPIDIAAQPLPQAIADLSARTGLQVLYTGAKAFERNSRAVTGATSAEQALRQMLQGTGITYRFVRPNAVTLEVVEGAAAAPGVVALDAIEVQGTRRELVPAPPDGIVAERSETGTKTNTPLIEIPQTINVVTARQIEDQGAQNVLEAVRYTPGIVAGFGDADNRNDVLQSRGFFVRYNLNGSRLPYGAYSFGFLRIEPYGLERIDILKGPSSVLYGQNTPGGLINLVSKRPTDMPLREVQLQYGSYDRFQGGLDVSDALDKDGKLRFRLTALARDAGGRVDYGRDNRIFVAPSLSWRPSEDTSLTFLSQYQRDDTISDYQLLPAAGTLRYNPNGKITPRRFTGEPAHDDFARTQYSLGYEFRHRLDQTWTLRQNLQYNHVDVTAKASPGYALDATQRLLSRVASRGQGGAATFTVDNTAEAVFATGPLRHNALVGLDYLYLDDSYRFASNLYSRPLDLYNPVYGQPIPALINRIDYRQTRNQVGLYAQDQITWDRWVLTVGGRQDWVNAATRNRLPYSTAKQNDAAFTGRAGLTYLFENGLAPYISYATSFNPVDGTDFSGQPFKPMTGQQYEAGLKFQPQGFRSFITLSAFDLTQRNVTTPDPNPTHIGFSVQTGEARVRGLEFEAKASLGKGLDLIGSYAYMQSEVTKANAAAGGASLLGKELPMVPAHQASAWLDYTFQSGLPSGFGLGGGVRYLADAWGDAANTLLIPSNTLVDAAIHYDFGKASPVLNGMALRVTATNLFDKDYVGYCQNTLQCSYGQGRTVLATLKYKW